MKCALSAGLYRLVRDVFGNVGLMALSVLFSALLFFFEIRHALNGGDPYAKNCGVFRSGGAALSRVQKRCPAF
jgi:hypothetical protein